MAYYEADEVGRLICNLAQWNGDSPIRSASSAWNSIAREVRSSWRSSFEIPVVGIDTGPTATALERIGETFSSALWTYHLSSLGFEDQARLILGIAKSTYHARLELGHMQFINAFREAQLQERQKAMHTYAPAPLRAVKL
jgi:hypothetical protein